MIYFSTARTGYIEKAVDLYSRRGAESAENCFVCFVLIPNAFAGFASWRDLLILFLAEAQSAQR